MTSDVRIEPAGQGAFRLLAEMTLPLPRDEVFAFFAEPGNLETITPSWLRFAIRTPGTIAMAEGTRIRYGLRLHGVPLRWESAITAYEPPYRFVDEQVRGPYRRWVHEHRFEERDGGCAVLDRVEYAPRGGAVANRLLVARDLLAIFRHRQVALAEALAAPRPSSG